jgi:predicted nucleic acid-binding protein
VGSYFLDSSAIVKRYLTEVGSGWVRSLTDPNAANDIFLARITGVEVISALVRQNPSLVQPLLTQNLAYFRADFQNQFQLLAINPAVISRAMDLAEVHRLRGYDSVQLGAALEWHQAAKAIGLQLVTFVSADAQLNAAAVREGLTVDDPVVPSLR